MVMGYKFILLILVGFLTWWSRVESSCYFRCHFDCSSGYGCQRVCTVVCSGSFGKRSIQENEVKIPLPDRFDEYDLDGDSAISLEELAKATHVDAHSKAAIDAFNLADKNDDGKIDCREFNAAPYLFKHRPTC